MYCRLFFSTKTLGSLTFNSVSSYSILKSLTSFIHHCFSCHQWWSRTESFPGCLPMCLLHARKVLSGLHPTYHFGMKKMVSRHALGNAPGKAASMHNHGGQGKETCRLTGQGTGAMVLSGGTAGTTAPHPCIPLIWPLMAHRKQQGQRPLAQPQALPARGCSLGSSLPAQSLERQFQVSPQWSQLQATGYPLRWKSISWLGIDATMPFS